MKWSIGGPTGEEEAGWKAEESRWRDGWREPAILELLMGVTRATRVGVVTCLMESSLCSGGDHMESSAMQPQAQANGGMKMVPIEERGILGAEA